MRGFALGLQLPEDHFDPYYTTSFWGMRLIRYPPALPTPPEDGGTGCGEHTDYGCLTVVNQDPNHPESLQAMKRDGEWVNVPPIDGHFPVNIGDMLSRWTNGRFRATPHRVMPTEGLERVSVPFFFEPNYDTRVEPLQCCVEPGCVPDFEAVVYGDHLLKKTSTNFAL